MALIQDNVPCHVSKKAVAWMSPRMQFWTQGVCPPFSDLNVLDYAISAHIQENVNKKLCIQYVRCTLEGHESSLKVMKFEWVKWFIQNVAIWLLRRTEVT